MQVVPAPAVGLGQVEVGAEERAGVAPVPVRAHAVGSPARRAGTPARASAAIVLDRLLGVVERVARAPRTGRCRRRRCSAKPADQLGERALGADRGPELLDRALGPGASRPTGPRPCPRSRQARRPASGLADGAEPGGDVPPALRGRRVHDVERVAQLREQALQVPEVALVVVVLDRLERELDVLADARASPARPTGPRAGGRRRPAGPLLAAEGGRPRPRPPVRCRPTPRRGPGMPSEVASMGGARRTRRRSGRSARRSGWRSVIRRSSSTQPSAGPATGRGRVAGGHQRLADQHGVVAGVGQAGGVVRAADARLGHPHDPVGHAAAPPGPPGRCRPRRSTRSRWLTPDQRRRRPPAPDRARPRRAPRPARRARPRRPARAGRPARRRRARPRSAGRSRRPSSRASHTSCGPTVKSLRSTGSADRGAGGRAGRRPSRRSSRSSVSTDRHGGAARLVPRGERRRDRGREPRSPFGRRAALHLADDRRARSRRRQRGARSPRAGGMARAAVDQRVERAAVGGRLRAVVLEDRVEVGRCGASSRTGGASAAAPSRASAGAGRASAATRDADERRRPGAAAIGGPSPGSLSRRRRRTNRPGRS